MIHWFLMVLATGTLVWLTRNNWFLDRFRFLPHISWYDRDGRGNREDCSLCRTLGVVWSHDGVIEPIPDHLMETRSDGYMYTKLGNYLPCPECAGLGFTWSLRRHTRLSGS